MQLNPKCAFSITKILFNFLKIKSSNFFILFIGYYRKRENHSGKEAKTWQIKLLVEEDFLVVYASETPAS